MPRPIIPAITLLFKALTPIVAVCTDDVISSKEVGSAPPLIRAAVDDASSLGKPLPLVISQLKPDMVDSAVGADIIWSSNIITMALLYTKVPSLYVMVAFINPLEACLVASSNCLEPSFVNSRVIL